VVGETLLRFLSSHYGIAILCRIADSHKHKGRETGLLRQIRPHNFRA